MDDLTISAMQQMQAELQEKYFDRWGGLSPAQGRSHLLWLLARPGRRRRSSRRRATGLSWIVPKPAPISWRSSATYICTWPARPCAMALRPRSSPTLLWKSTGAICSAGDGPSVRLVAAAHSRRFSCVFPGFMGGKNFSKKFAYPLAFRPWLCYIMSIAPLR